MRRVTIVTGLMMMSLAIGCGSHRYPQLGAVTGVVKANNVPLVGVAVTFVPNGRGASSYGTTNEKGEFRLVFSAERTGALVGTHSVLIQNAEPATDDFGQPLTQSESFSVPGKYQEVGHLTAKVNPGKNTFEFALEPAGLLNPL